MQGTSLLDLEAGYPDTSRMEECGVEEGRKKGERRVAKKAKKAKKGGIFNIGEKEGSEEESRFILKPMTW